MEVSTVAPPDTKVTDAGVLQERPPDEFAARVTVPRKLFIDVTVTVDDPELVASMLDGETAPRVML